LRLRGGFGAANDVSGTDACRVVSIVGSIDSLLYTSSLCSKT
jgi:hypothetical protein